MSIHEHYSLILHDLEIIGPSNSEMIRFHIDKARELSQPVKTRKEVINRLREASVVPDHLISVSKDEITIATYITPDRKTSIERIPDFSFNYNIPNEDFKTEVVKYFLVPSLEILVKVAYKDVPGIKLQSLKNFAVSEINKLAKS